MPGQSRLLVDVLDWHEAHVALARCRRNRLGIVGVVFGQWILVERAYELCGHQARHQSVFQAAPRPMVCTAAGFRRDHRPGGQLCQVQGERITLELPPPYHPAGGVRLAHCEHALCQVHTEGYSAHGEPVPSQRTP